MKGTSTPLRGDALQSLSKQNRARMQPGEIQLLDLIDPDIELFAPRPLTAAEKAIADRAVYLWVASLHGMLSQMNKLYRAPVKRSLLTLIKPRIEYLQALFDLCAACHARWILLSDSPNPYPNAADWFGLIFQETLYGVVNELINPPENSSVPKFSKNPKRDSLAAARRAVKAMKSPVPSNPYRDRKTVHTNLVFQSAIELSQLEGQGRFHKTVFLPFVKAWSGEIDMLESPAFKRCEVSDRGAYMVLGSTMTKKL